MLMKNLKAKNKINDAWFPHKISKRTQTENIETTLTLQRFLLFLYFFRSFSFLLLIYQNFTNLINEAKNVKKQYQYKSKGKLGFLRFEESECWDLVFIWFEESEGWDFVNFLNLLPQILIKVMNVELGLVMYFLF